MGVRPYVRTWCVVAALAVAAGCSSVLPVQNPRVLSIHKQPEPLTLSDPAYATTLQVRWLGTASCVIQMGDAAIVTDPFYTHHGALRTLLCTLESDPKVVAGKAALVPRQPLGVFVGHAHYDHMLDAVALQQAAGWSNVALFGSATATNLASAMAAGGPAYRLATVELDDKWKPVGATGGVAVAYKAFTVMHAPHVACLRLYHGHSEKPLTKPPRKAGDFPDGQAYIFAFQFTSAAATQTVYFMSSGSLPNKFPPGEKADLLILCGALWKNVAHYPEALIRNLEPRHVMLSHHDNLFQTNKRPVRGVWMLDLPKLLDLLQKESTYTRFEAIHVPAVDTLIRVPPPLP